MADVNLNPVEAKLPLKFNGLEPAEFIKRAYGLGVDLNGPGRFDMKDPVQQQLRKIRDWITMAEHDALDARKQAHGGESGYVDDVVRVASVRPIDD